MRVSVEIEDVADIRGLFSGYANHVTGRNAVLAGCDKLKKRLLARIERGHYANVGDYVRDLVRKDLERRERLVAEPKKGEASGLSSRRVPEIFATVRRAAKARRND